MNSTTPDPITSQVLGSYMRAVADEVEIALIRSAYSPVIKESFDCSAGIVDPKGEYWAQADAIPLQLSVLASVVKSVLDQRRGAFAPGDLYFTNDPLSGVAHLNDFVSIAPVIVEGELLCFVCTLVHHTDVGGAQPGSAPPDATDILQEGFRFPVQRLITSQGWESPLLDLLRANSRTPTTMLGDLRAQVASSRLGVKRLEEVAARLGIDALRRHMKSYQDYSERMASSLLLACTPGAYSATRFLDNADPADTREGLRVVADVTLGAGRVEVDYSRSSDQVQRPLNAVMSNGLAAAIVAVRCMFTSELPLEAGWQRLVSVRCRAGAIMNPELPAPVGARAVTVAAAFDCVLDCLGQSTPGLAVASASGGTTMPILWAPLPEAGAERRILLDMSLTGGSGASGDRDGVDAIDNTVTNAANFPVEILEQEFPVIVERHEIRIGTGGSGIHRGGSGLRRVMRFLAPGVLALRGHHYQYAPKGIFGGESGQPSAFSLRRGTHTERLPPQASGIVTQPNDVLIAETPGGGGYGQPDPASKADHGDSR